MDINNKLREIIPEVADFPVRGISFKDITPLLLRPDIIQLMNSEMAERARAYEIDIVAGIDARGFLLGPMLAQNLNAGFVPIRKKGKLPRTTIETSYELEYGEATLAVHAQDIPKGSRVLLHDDLLATGGTASAAVALLRKAGAEVVTAQFIIALDFLPGREKLENIPVEALVHYG